MGNYEELSKKDRGKEKWKVFVEKKDLWAGPECIYITVERGVECFPPL